MNPPLSYIINVNAFRKYSRFNNPAYDKVLAQASTENTVKA